MSFRRFLAASVLAATVAVAPSVLAADDAFLVVDGIPGDSVEINFKNAISIRSYSLAVTVAGGVAGGKPTLGPLNVTKGLDKATPALFKAAAFGNVIPKVELSLRKAGTTAVYYKVTLNNATVTAVKQSDNVSDSSVATEEIAFSFQKITIETWAQDAKGMVQAAPKFTYDVTTAKAF